jgi:deoxyribonuclease-4
LFFGLHVSIGKGLARAVQTAEALTCECLQIFAGNPRGWARKPLDEKEVRRFQSAREASSIKKVAVHLSYLPNLASADAELYEKSVLAMGEDYRRAVSLGADYFVVHPGAGGDGNKEEALEKVAKGINTVLTEVRGETLILLENQAGGGTELAGDLRDLGLILGQVKEAARTGICLDTCHAYAAGYELRTAQGLAEVWQEVEEAVGLDRLYLLHLNDCLGEKGSHLDRHTHIGEGKIGLAGFKLIVNHPALIGRAGVMETPRSSDQDDLRNLEMIRSLVAGGQGQDGQ